MNIAGPGGARRAALWEPASDQEMGSWEPWPLDLRATAQVWSCCPSFPPQPEHPHAPGHSSSAPLPQDVSGSGFRHLLFYQGPL